MSHTARYPGTCGRCGATFPAGAGVVRNYTGAARKRAPAGAVPAGYGLRYVLCEACDTLHRQENGR